MGNPDMNRNFHVKIDRVPGKQKHVVTFKVQDFDLSKVDGNFEIQVEGTSMGESVKGSIKGEANPKGNRVKVEFEKGNKNGVTMWTYKTKRTTTRTPEKFEME